MVSFVRSTVSFAAVVTNEHKTAAPVSKCAPRAPMAPIMDLEAPSSSSSSPSPSVKTSSVTSNGVGQSKWLEDKLNQEVHSFSDNSHRENLQIAADAFRKMMAEQFPEICVWMTGSFPAGVDLEGSDLDFTLKIEKTEGQVAWNLHTLREAIMRYKCSAFEGDRFPHHEFGRCNVVGVQLEVLQMEHLATGISIDVTANNDAPKRNTQLLVWYGQVDTRFPLLCRAVKRWASHNGVANSKRSGLNSFSICLLVLHFLQTRAKILPNLQEVFPELQGEFEVEDDDYERRNLREEMEAKGIRRESVEVGVGTLFVAFLKYYAKFDFHSKWISIRHGKALKKRRDPAGIALDGMPECSSLICIKDPFLQVPWNCAGTVWFPDTYHRIRFEFRHSYQRVLREKSIFTMGQKSEVRRRIDLEGKQRDQQGVRWLREHQLSQWKLGGSAESEHVTRNRVKWAMQGFTRYQRPEYYDNWIVMPKRKNASQPVPWPVPKREERMVFPE